MVALITAAIGKEKVDNLAPAQVRALATHFMSDGGLPPTTARNGLAVLRKALNDALSEGVSSRKVATLVKAPARAHY